LLQKIGLVESVPQTAELLELFVLGPGLGDVTLSQFLGSMGPFLLDLFKNLLLKEVGLALLQLGPAPLAEETECSPWVFWANAALHSAEVYIIVIIDLLLKYIEIWLGMSLVL